MFLPGCLFGTVLPVGFTFPALHADLREDKFLAVMECFFAFFVREQAFGGMGPLEICIIIIFHVRMLQ